ncbi:CBM35 domain-containing protein [Streptomyces sp. 7N604]|uniref:CBM35 domain-containing protein n=1 Tax=Streptomyces sp. 7N604 TaxID=3457415 RepID=UPI003FD35B46
MTAGNNGASTPENDDPFAYLYRSEDGEGGAGADSAAAPRTGGYGYPPPELRLGGAPSPAQPGVPRTSYNQVSRVGERRYGQQAQQGQQAPYATQPQQSYGQQTNPHYAAPETFPGGTPNRPAPPSHGGAHGGGGRGPNSRGLLIGAIAVVAVVVIGIGVAMLTNNTGGEGKQDEAGNSAPPSAAESVDPSEDPGDEPQTELPKADAASLRVDSPATTDSSIKGAKSATGAYVGMNAPGAAATWNMDVDKAGEYRLYVRYGVPGKDADLTLTTNGKPSSQAINMKNFAGAKAGDWEHGWQHTWSTVNLTKGTNTIKLSCETGNACEVNLDRVALRPGSGGAPDGW